ncbi:hypothetical protein C162_21788 [Paenibacillus sp. FSL R7-269]|uniref:baseplate J/gp47 family protein n=1 Tax=Paenibacillus sp. FSL R7-269 TaxID=1226755 RepID=UPI0003E22931|nr:baseplate J/gp47 family protein [Paenibacillus sp. FSL R7-269]ETT45212.1 hypothetical protein C162_21788 [Paenibacillus sp. FSL R7-269]
MDEQGFKRQRFAEILADVEDKAKEVFGEELDTAEKSPMGMILRLFAWHLGKADERLEDVYNSASINASTGASLYKLGGNDGLSVYSEEYASGFIAVTGTPGYELLAGFLVATASGIRFETINTVTLSSEGTGTVEIMAVEMGASGNVPAGTVTVVVNPNPDIMSVTNAQQTQDGRDRETDAAFRERVLQRRQNPGTSGNKADYLRWSREVPGVGAAKVFPLWAGPKTVKVVIADADKLPASSLLVSQVQRYIDPDPGQGEGTAPIGAVVTVAAAVAKTINISATVVLAAGYTLQSVHDAFLLKVEDWRGKASFSVTYVSHAVIGALLLGTDGIIDYSELTLNGGAGNVPLSAEEVPVIGVVELEV